MTTADARFGASRPVGRQTSRRGSRNVSRPVTWGAAVPSVFVAVTVAVMAVHTLARGHLWRYEWMWAAYQYHFGVLLIGPLVCGVAAWSGRSVGTARWLTRPAGDVSTPLRTLGLAITATTVAYVLAFVVPAVVVLRSDTTDPFRWSVAATFVPALVALAAYVSVGFAVGVRRPGRLMAPAAAIVAFAVTMAGWIGGAEHLVRLGGASASMVGLVPRPVVQVVQVVAYGCLGGAAAGWSFRRLGGGRVRSQVVTTGLVLVALFSGGWLATTTSPVFDHPTVREVCVAGGDGQRLCAPFAYERPLHRLAEQLRPLLARLGAAGAPVTGTVHLGQAVELFEPDPGPSVVGTELAPMLGLGDCMTVRPSDDEVYLAIWLALVIGDTEQTDNARLDPDLPAALAGNDTAAQDAWARQALAKVRSECGADR